MAEPIAPEPPTGTTRDQDALQSAFLAGNLGRPVVVFLVNGIRLVGTLRQFNYYYLLLEGTYDIETMIFKHMISTIVPASR